MQDVAEQSSTQGQIKHPIATIAVGRIRVRGERRPLDRDRVASLGASIAELGLLNPITVTLDDDSKDYWLVAGRHRMAAVTGLGWREVPAIILDCGDLLCDLAEIDENLCRAELTPGQRAEATARRKSIWERLHPEATVAAKRAEGARKTHAKLGRGDAPLERSGASSSAFVNDTASKTGRSTASVRRDAQIGEALLASPDAAEVVHSSPKPIAQSELLAIAQAPKEERKAAAEKAVEKAKAPKAKRQLHPAVAARSKASSTTVAPTGETAPTAAPVLSDRDQKIRDLYTDGRTTKEIAEELGLSVSVVQTAKGRLGFAKRAPDNPFHGLIFGVRCLASNLRSGIYSEVLQKKPATEEHIAEAVAALDRLVTSATSARARLLAGTFGDGACYEDDDDDEDTDDDTEQEAQS